MRTKRIGGMLAALAVSTLAVPAEAGERNPRRHHRHHDEDKVTGGDIVLAAALIGAVALFSKKKRSPVPPPVDAEAVPVSLTLDEASDACGRAAEMQGAHLARVVQTRQVGSVDAAGSGWVARGFVSLRDDYRQPDSAPTRGFRCTIADAGLPRVEFDGEAPAMAGPQP